MTIKVALMGRKGGITKTTLAVNLAAGCARQGLRTLLVDADGQGNASSSVRVQPHDAFCNLVLADAEWAEVLVQPPVQFDAFAANLWLLSSSNLQREVEISKHTPQQIYDRFDELNDSFDVVIVDTSPGITEVHAGFYYACDYILLPTLCEFSSIKSLESTLEYLRGAAAEGAKVGLTTAQVLGVIPNCFNGKEKVQQSNIGYIKGRYDQHMRIFDVIRNLTVWKQASQLRQSIYQYAPEDDYNARRQARTAVGELSPVLDALLGLKPHSAVA